MTETPDPAQHPDRPAAHVEEEIDPGGPLTNLPEKTFRFPSRKGNREDRTAMTINVEQEAWRDLLLALHEHLSCPDPVYFTDGELSEVGYDAIFDRSRGIFDELCAAHPDAAPAAVKSAAATADHVRRNAPVDSTPMPVPGLPANLRLTPGMAVMVPTGVIAAQVNGQPPIICYATVMHLAGPADREIYQDDPGEVWWLNVHCGGGARLPQMYRRSEILGLPAYGLDPGSALVDVPAWQASDPPRSERPLSELSTTGILWLINRVVFHPRGFALYLQRAGDGTITGWGLQGDGSDVWHFADQALEDKHLADVEALLASHRRPLPREGGPAT